jgi:Family of unknown function (DUF6173)
MTTKPDETRGAVQQVGAQVARPGEPVRPSVARSPAEWAYERLVKYVLQFEAQLDQDHELGGRLVSFGPQMQFHILDLGYWNPDIITFDGLDQNGNRVRLIQNVSQLNVLLVAMQKRKPDEPPRRIGFELEAGRAGTSVPERKPE